MSISIPTAAATVRTFARGFTSSARIYAEAPASSAPAAPTSAPRPRTNNSSQRPSHSGSKVSDRLRAGQRNRPPSQQSGQNGSRNAGGERRSKRLPSVFDGSSTSPGSRLARGVNVKAASRGAKLPAPLPSTDWNSPLFSKPGFERLLAPAPRPSSIFVPSLTAAAPSAPASPKGKGKAAAPVEKVGSAKLNLPGIKTAVNGLKLHIRPGGRNVLGPVNNPTAVASGAMSQNRVVLARSSQLKAGDDKSLAVELKAARIALQNEQIGGSYERFGSQSVLKAAGVQANAQGSSTQAQAVQNAAQALSINPDIAPEGKSFVAKTIADRLSS